MDRNAQIRAGLANCVAIGIRLTAAREGIALRDEQKVTESLVPAAG